MLLGVLSDSHGQIYTVQRAVVMLESLRIDVVAHCGDIGDPRIIEILAPWPVHLVLGNVDYHAEPLREAARRAGAFFYGTFGQFELDGRKIALLHGDDFPLLQKTIESGQFDLVCYGHTHAPTFRQAGPTLILNPGGLYRATRPTVAVVDLTTMRPEIIPLD